MRLLILLALAALPFPPPITRCRHPPARMTMNGSAKATVLLVLAAFAAHPAGACTMTTTIQVELFPGQALFAGEVLGYTGPYIHEMVRGEFWGLRLRVLDVVYLPRNFEEAEVILTSLGTDCTPVGFSRDRLEEWYPAGVRLLVDARPTRMFPDDRAARFEIFPPVGALTQWRESRPDVIRREFDYQSEPELQDGSGRRIGRPDEPIEHFELQKEFARLARSSRKERVRILERLLYHRTAPFDFIVRRHLGRSPAARRLIGRWRVENAWVPLRSRYPPDGS